MEPLVVEAGKVGGVEVPMGRRRQPGEKRVLAGGKAEPVDVGAVDGGAVQRHGALVPHKTQHALHQRGLARAVLPEQPHDLPAWQRQGHIVQRLLGTVFLTDMADLKHM